MAFMKLMTFLSKVINEFNYAQNDGTFKVTSACAKKMIQRKDINTWLDLISLDLLFKST